MWFHRLGLERAKRLLLDGAARHTPEGTEFSRDAAADLKAAVRAHDEPFGDYGYGSRTVADPLA
jgi:hypothetical protein